MIVSRHVVRDLKLVEKSLTGGRKKIAKHCHHNATIIPLSRGLGWLDMLKYKSSRAGGSLRSIWSLRELLSKCHTVDEVCEFPYSG